METITKSHIFSPLLLLYDHPCNFVFRGVYFPLSAHQTYYGAFHSLSLSFRSDHSKPKEEICLSVPSRGAVSDSIPVSCIPLGLLPAFPAFLPARISAFRSSQ